MNLAQSAPLLRASNDERVMVDVDDTIIEVHGYQKQGAWFGNSGVRGLNALIATASTPASVPVILAQRLRQGKTGSPKGAARIVGDALTTLRRLNTGSSARPLLRTDSAFYGHTTVGTAIKAGADVSVKIRMDRAVKAAIASIPEDGWEMIEYIARLRPALHNYARTTTGSGKLTTADTSGTTESEVDDRDETPGTHPCPPQVTPRRSGRFRRQRDLSGIEHRSCGVADRAGCCVQ